MADKLTIKPHTTLYQSYAADIAYIKDDVKCSQISKIVNLGITAKDNLHFHFFAEMFRRQQTANYMSEEINDFWNQLAYIYDELLFTTDDKGNTVSIDNYKKISENQSSVIQEMRKTFRGADYENILSQVESAGKDSYMLLNQLTEYKLYGLFFPGLYGPVMEQSRIKTISDILDATDLVIKETYSPQQENDTLVYRMKGEMINPDLEAWISEAKKLGVDIKEGQYPILEQYEGEFIFDKSMSVMEKAEFRLSLSFGEQYKRDKICNLILMSEKDLKELLPGK